MLAATTSCDDGIRYHLTCDGCGLTFAAPASVSGVPDQLWDDAERVGWLTVPLGDRLEHRCRDCTRAAITSGWVRP